MNSIKLNIHKTLLTSTLPHFTEYFHLQKKG